jgi:hypothetical protein
MPTKKKNTKTLSSLLPKLGKSKAELITNYSSGSYDKETLQQEHRTARDEVDRSKAEVFGRTLHKIIHPPTGVAHEAFSVLSGSSSTARAVAKAHRKTNKAEALDEVLTLKGHGKRLPANSNSSTLKGFSDSIIGRQKTDAVAGSASAYRKVCEYICIVSNYLYWALIDV